MNLKPTVACHLYHTVVHMEGHKRQKKIQQQELDSVAGPQLCNSWHINVTSLTKNADDGQDDHTNIYMELHHNSTINDESTSAQSSQGMYLSNAGRQRPPSLNGEPVRQQIHRTLISASLSGTRCYTDAALQLDSSNNIRRTGLARLLCNEF